MVSVRIALKDLDREIQRLKETLRVQQEARRNMEFQIAGLEHAKATLLSKNERGPHQEGQKKRNDNLWAMVRNVLESSSKPLTPKEIFRSARKAMEVSGWTWKDEHSAIASISSVLSRRQGLGRVSRFPVRPRGFSYTLRKKNTLKKSK